MDRIEDRIDDEGNLRRLGLLGEPDERAEIGMGLRNQDRRHRIFAGDVERRLGEAEQKIRARCRAAFEFAGIGKIDAYFMPRRLQRAHAIFKMREGRVGQTAEVDHVGAVGAHFCGAVEDFINGEIRRIDDLAEDANILL